MGERHQILYQCSLRPAGPHIAPHCTDCTAGVSHRTALRPPAVKGTKFCTSAAAGSNHESFLPVGDLRAGAVVLQGQNHAKIFSRGSLAIFRLSPQVVVLPVTTVTAPAPARRVTAS